MNCTFIYCPRSGDRVFCESPNDYIRIVSWFNGCRHVQGGVHLCWPAAVPNFYWRGEAQTLATQIVATAGGIGWDENGMIHIIVPVHAAFAAWQWMQAASLVSLCPPDTNSAALVIGGAAVMDGMNNIVPRCVREEIPDWANIDLPTWTDYRPDSVAGGTELHPEPEAEEQGVVQ